MLVQLSPQAIVPASGTVSVLVKGKGIVKCMFRCGIDKEVC